MLPVKKDVMRDWIRRAPKKIGKSVTKQQLYFIYKLIANRQSYQFTFKSIIKNLIQNYCHCGRRRRDKKRRKADIDKTLNGSAPSPKQKYTADAH